MRVHILHCGTHNYTKHLHTQIRSIQMRSLQHTATHCDTLQHTATHCNTLQHTHMRNAQFHKTLTHTNTEHSDAIAATHCNTLQHTATHTYAERTISQDSYTHKTLTHTKHLHTQNT